MNKKLLTKRLNAQVTLAKSKTLVSITNKILLNKPTIQPIIIEHWVQKLQDWSKLNLLRDFEYINDIKRAQRYCRGIPHNKEELLELKRLNLQWNRLASIPKEIFNLKSLVILELMNNNLQTLPSDISLLSDLEELNLNINNLKYLPNEIIKLKKLKYLNIKNNKYLELSEEQVGWLKKLIANNCIVEYDKYKFNLGE